MSRSTPSHAVVLNGATSQYDRWLRALDPLFAPVDGRSFCTLLEFSVEFGRLIYFYNLQDQIDGDWVEFFINDPTILLATIEALDLAQVEETFFRLEKETLEARRFRRKFRLLRDTFAVILGLARQVDLWLRGLGEAPENSLTRALNSEIALAIENELARALQTLQAYDQGAGLPSKLGQPIGLDYEGFSSIWGLPASCPDGTPYQGDDQNQMIDHALPYLVPLFYAFIDAIERLQVFAQENFAASLELSDHNPQSALYIAFVRLFQTAQDTINTFSERFVDFYYHDVLRLRPRGPIPESVFLTFSLQDDEDVLQTTVPRGTLFPAGEDRDGLELIYALDTDLLVTSARIARLRTVRVNSGKLVVGPDTGQDNAADHPAQKAPTSSVTDVLDSIAGVFDGFVHTILESEIVLDEEAENAAGQTPGLETDAWPTFGRSEIASSPVEVTRYATVGFAVSSPYLLLTGGSRTITLDFTLTDESRENVQTLLADIVARSTCLSPQTPETVFGTLMEGAFQLYLSNALGWFSVARYEVTYPSPSRRFNRAFSLTLTLNPSAPAVQPYDPDSQEEPDDSGASTVEFITSGLPVVDSRSPTLLFGVEQPARPPCEGSQERVYPLSLLDAMEVQEIAIAVSVDDLPGLQISNTNGEVDTTSPYPVFGGLPMVGSFVQIAHTELFVKRLKKLEPSIQWFDLPQDTTGFQGYYRDYTIGPDGEPSPTPLFENNTFCGVFQIVNPGLWTLKSGSDAACASASDPSCNETLPPNTLGVALFRTRDGDGNDDGDGNGNGNGDGRGPGCSGPTPDGRLCPFTDFDSLVPRKHSRPDFYDPATSAIRLSLTCPPYAFGNSLFPVNVLNSVIEALPNTDQCTRYCLDKCKTQQDDPAKYSACLTDCMNNCLEPDRPLTYPNDPYLPQATAITIKSYTASCILWTASDADTCGAFFHLLPFDGYNRIPSGARSPGDQTSDHHGEQSGSWLLPRFQFAGNLYLGFSRLIPPQTLTLLFQMTGSAAPNQDCVPPVNWDYLSNNRWKCLSASQILIDTTNGLQNTGVVALGLPAYDPDDNTVLSSEYQWLRAAVAEEEPLEEPEEYSEEEIEEKAEEAAEDGSKKDLLGHVVSGAEKLRDLLCGPVTNKPDHFPDTVAVYAHATLATWRDQENSGEHLARPLPAFTIESSIEDLPDIASILQPMRSFGGRPPENDQTFKIRVGERLRHKDRAILSWDYERLVLERFPTIWKVQALPARCPRRGRNPGDVLVVVVAGPDSTQVQDPTMPMANNDQLGRIERFLEQRVNPFLTVHVVNPVYVRIEVKASVAFRINNASGASVARLDRELVEYLSPWFFDADRAARGGDYASESDISEFIQNRPYVSTLESIELCRSPDPDVTPLEWYFLTSAERHDITDVNARETCDGERSGY